MEEEGEGREGPLHVASFDTSEGKDSVFDEDVEGKGVDALLIEHDKPLFRDCSTDLILQFDNLFQFCVDKASFALDEFLTLFGRRVKKSGIDFTFLVFQRYIQSQDVSVFNPFWHVGMTCPVVED